MGVKTDSVLVRDNTLPATDLESGVVILNVHTDTYARLNGVARDIWQMLEEPRDVADILSRLLQAYDVDEVALSRDVLPFLQDLIERGIARQIHGDSR